MKLHPPFRRKAWRSRTDNGRGTANTPSILRVLFTSSLLFYSTLLTASSFHANGPIPEAVASKITDDVSRSYRFTDRKGIHVLVLTSSRSRIEDSDKWELRAIQFVNTDDQWMEEWRIRDWVYCPDLDIDAKFLPEFFTFTDLDKDGITETTVSYSLLCTGAVEPSTIKTIMREGEDKYAVRGESLIKVESPIPGKKGIEAGGTYKADWTLDSRPEFKNHLISVWKKAAGVTKK